MEANVLFDGLFGRYSHRSAGEPLRYFQLDPLGLIYPGTRFIVRSEQLVTLHVCRKQYCSTLHLRPQWLCGRRSVSWESIKVLLSSLRSDSSNSWLRTPKFPIPMLPPGVSAVIRPVSVIICKLAITCGSGMRSVLTDLCIAKGLVHARLRRLALAGHRALEIGKSTDFEVVRIHEDYL